MPTQTISPLSRPGSTPLRIPARRPAANRAWFAVVRLGSGAFFGAAVALAVTLIGAGPR